MFRLSVHYKKLLKLNYHGKVIKNQRLKEFTTFKLGGNASLYLEICTLENFIKVMMYIEKFNLPYFVFGNGSKLLVADNGFDGIVIKLKGDFARINIHDEFIECGAGVCLGALYQTAKNLSLSGLEESVGIPATIGGATYMNAQAYNFEMAKIVDYVVAYVDKKITYFTQEQCEFSYRSSVFQKNKAIILRVGIKLSYLDKDLIQSKYEEVLSFRKQSQPLNLPSAGSVFKRVNGMTISKMLDDAGFKGKKVNGAEVSTKHANFIVNNGATSLDVYTLIEEIKKEFFEIYKINLDNEIIYVGEFDEINK